MAEQLTRKGTRRLPVEDSSSPITLFSPFKSPESTNNQQFYNNEYIVVLKKGTSADEFSNHRHWAADIHASRLAKRGFNGTTGLRYTYDFEGFKGYSGSFDDDTINEIATSSQVR